MKFQYIPALVILAPLGAAQSPQLLEYRSLCSEGQGGGTKSFDNGVTADYTCHVKVTSDTDPTEQPASSSGDCAAMCGSGCSSAVWQYTKNRCLLYNSAVTMKPHARGSIYLKPTGNTEDENNDESGETEKSDCQHEKKACEDDLEYQTEQAQVCEQEKEGLQSQIDHNSQSYAELGSDLAFCQQEKDELDTESKTCQQEKDDLDTRSKTCQQEKDDLDTRSKTCQQEKDDLDTKSKTCQREKDDLDTKSKTCQREKDDLDTKSKTCQQEKDDLDTKSKTCQREKDDLDTKSKTCQREKDDLDTKSKTCQQEKDELDTKSKTCQREKGVCQTDLDEWKKGNNGPFKNAWKSPVCNNDNGKLRFTRTNKGDTQAWHVVCNRALKFGPHSMPYAATLGDCVRMCQAHTGTGNRKCVAIDWSPTKKRCSMKAGGDSSNLVRFEDYHSVYMAGIIEK